MKIARPFLNNHVWIIKFFVSRIVWLENEIWFLIFSSLHGETFYMNFYQSILQFKDKLITLGIFSTKILNFRIVANFTIIYIQKFHTILLKFSIFTDKNSQSYMFVSNLKNALVKIDIKSFSVLKYRNF